MAYLDKERREGMVMSATDSRMEEEDDDCWGMGASFILATQAIVAREYSVSVLLLEVDC